VPLFFLLAVYFLTDPKRRWLFLVFLFLAVCCKEDIALLGAMLGAVIFFREKRRTFGMVVFVGCTLWFVLAVNVWIPHFRQQTYSHTAIYEEMGGSFTGILRTVIFMPDYTLKFIFSGTHRAFLWKSLGAVLFLPLFSIWGILLILTPVSICLLASKAAEQYLITQYPAVWLPAAFVAIVFALVSVKRKGGGNLPFAISLTLLIVSVILPARTDVPSWRKIIRTSHWERVYRKQGFAEDARLVLGRFDDPDASVSAQTIFVPHLANREDIYQFPDVEDADYILVDISDESNKYPVPTDYHHAKVIELIQEMGYGVADNEGIVYLLKMMLKLLYVLRMFLKVQLLLIMMGIVIKIVLRLAFNIKYVWVTPYINF